MKLNNIVLNANDFANEMAKLRNEKHFDFLVTIVGEDFGEEGFGCIYILENTQTYESRLKSLLPTATTHSCHR